MTAWVDCGSGKITTGSVATAGTRSERPTTSTMAGFWCRNDPARRIRPPPTSGDRICPEPLAV
ncbi:MAG: hypothetical protein J7L73_09735, partial [Anaerolineales bacterium]|nr:hypothetical protein [Anaerolineales bacterium]